jgi:hypothetical protein
VIDLVDATLKTLLESQVNGLTVGFDAPNDAWRTQVAQAGGDWLNVYLAELRENRTLRSNELVDEWRGGQLFKRPAPARLDCHYVVSAWSRAGISGTPLIEATIEESVVLYNVTRVLMRNSPLDVGAIYVGGGLVPPELVEQPLPTVVVPPEGFSKLADFWGRMEWVWKPVVELVVTLPVAVLAEPAGPPVTTVFGEVMQRGVLETSEELIVVGGVVLGGTPPQPVQNAWIRIIELDRLVSSDRSGRFVIANVPRGLYHVEAGALGHGAPAKVEIEVPSTSGKYELVLV